ncbi:MAG: FG-GAP repeat domain-containing protein [bacterium]
MVHFLWSAGLFKIYELHYTGQFKAYHLEDLNHDGLKDVILVSTRGAENGAAGRWLSIYLQNRQGFTPQPQQSFELEDQVILFDIGDVVGDQNNEFVYFAEDGLYYYALGDSGYVLKPTRLFKTDSIFMLSDKRSIHSWNFVADLNGDGVDEVLVPKITKIDIHFRDPDKTGWLVNEVAMGMQPTVSGYFNRRFSVGSKVEASYATPFLLYQDFDADGRKDLLGVYHDSLLVFCQKQSGFFSQECQQRIPLDYGDIWRGGKIQRTHLGDKSEQQFLMKIQDLNGDGVVDIISTRVSTKESFISPKNEVLVYFGKRRRHNATTAVYFDPEPDQVIRPGGNQIVLDIVDLNKDGKSDFIIPVVKVGLKNLIKMLLTKRVELEAEIYLMGEDDLYPKKPDRQTKMVVRFSFKGGAASPVYEIADFNGDGNLDIMTSMEEKRLVLFRGNKKNILDASPGNRFNVILPQSGDMVYAEELNGDGKSDLVITYDEDEAGPKKVRNVLRVLLTR